MKNLTTRIDIQQCQDIELLRSLTLHLWDTKNINKKDESYSSWEREQYSELLREKQDRERNGYMNGG